MDDGRWTVDGGRWTVDGGRWTVDGKIRTIRIIRLKNKRPLQINTPVTMAQDSFAKDMCPR